MVIKSDLHYNPDTGIFTWVTGRRKGMQAGWSGKDGYVYIQYKGRKLAAHVWAFEYMGDDRPNQIDHINQIKNDNRWINLRPSNNSQNQHNTPIRGKVRYRGVSWKKDKKKYVAKISWREGGKHKSKHLGYFDCPEEAAEAYNREAISRYGF